MLTADQEITHIHSASYEASGDLSDRFDTPQGTRQAAAGETTPKLSYVLARVSAPGTDTPTAKAGKNYNLLIIFSDRL